MNNKIALAVGLFLILVVGVVVLFVLPPKAQAPTQVDTGNAAAKADKIQATAPLPNSTISSPLTVTGKARGTWYFEASFPYQLKDAAGNTLAQGPVQAQGDWMTENFVPFSVSISFPPQPAGSKGTLILKKDNPSGDPARDEELDIPVTF